MRAFVFGASGLLGRHLVRELRARGVSLAEYIDPGTHVVFNAVGLASVDRADEDPSGAYYANAELAEVAAIAAAGHAALFVHASTEFVFDGSNGQIFDDFDEPRPSSVYAKSKRAGEILVAAAYRRHQIVRLQNLYGEGGENLLSRICSHSGDRLVLDDERCIAPMWAGTAARLLCDIAATGRFGTWHATAKGMTTYYGFAKQANPEARAASGLITTKLYRPSIRLLCQRMAMLGMKRPTWQESLDEYLANKER